MLDGSLAMTSQLLEELAAAGFDDLRPAHLQVVQHLDQHGSRITELANRAQLTKQTVVHTVNDLARLGYIQRVPDGRDARAKLVIPTERGRAAIATGVRIVQNIERRWADLIGTEELQRLRELLLALNAAIWPE
jgi:DNA-binding MarR family transcriptional regulator